MIKIAVIGASYLQLPLVEKINALGYQSHCFAWDNLDSVCKGIAHYFYPISIVDKEAILEKCREIQIDAILSIASDVAVPTIAFIAEKLGLIANSVFSASISTNKFLMRSRFLEAGLKSPKYYSITSSDKILLKEQLNFPLIVKPTDRSGSRGVTIANNQRDLEDNILRAIEASFEKKAIVEEFIEGPEYSVESISEDGVHTILAITEKVTSGPPYFVELEHHQPAKLNSLLEEQINQLVIAGLNALDIKFGASHTELKISKRGVFIIEIGARMGGDFIGSHLVELSTGYDYLKNTINTSLGIKIESFVKKDEKYSGVYFLSKLNAHLEPYFSNNLANIIEKKILSNELVEVLDSSNRIGYLIYQHDTKIRLNER